MILLRPCDVRFPQTQGFGENPKLYPSTNGHMGLDYGLPLGSKVVASAKGQVIFAGLDPETKRTPTAGYGIHVKLEHEKGEVTIYGHLDSTTVQIYDRVEMGQPIGLSGNTGRSTAPHLHFEYRPNGTTPADPSGLISNLIPNAAGLFTLEVTKDGNGLRIRNAPKTTSGIARQLKTGERITALGLGGTDMWLLTSEGYIKFDPSWLKII